MIGDTTTVGLQAALSGLEARRAAHEMNIANVETPGYRARKVQFESALRSALETGRADRAGFSVSRSTEPARLNGNNVNVGQEMVSLTETALRQQLVIRALNDKYGLLRDVIGGGR
ncbi:MAG: flagellar basal body rod protein FlgB [Acidimicrobiales bacterium]